MPGLTSAPCYVADVTASAGCQEWPADPTPTVAADHGNWIAAYPPVYYWAMNLFASQDIQSSAIVMRLINVFLFVGLTTLLAWLVPRYLRIPLLAGWVITAVPLGVYLIASNNPGAWALIGVGGSWISALGYFRSEGRRSAALGSLTALFVLMAAGARTDAAVYAILGLGIASFLAFEKSRSFLIKLSLPVALAVLAAYFYFSSGYSDVAEGGLTGGIPDSGSRNRAAVLAFNLISIPRLWTGIFGSWGLGWRMETWPGFSMVEFATLAVFIGLASIGLRHMSFRKAAMTLALIGTLYALPVYVLTVGLSVVSENVQPRYLLPLAVVLGALLLLTKAPTALQPGRWHVIPAMILLVAANSIALYINLRRYVTGLDVEQLSLEANSEWWWSGFPVGPTVLWVFGSVAFAATISILGIAWLRGANRIEVAA